MNEKTTKCPSSLRPHVRSMSHEFGIVPLEMAVFHNKKALRSRSSTAKLSIISGLGRCSSEPLM
jgi:hypothetical protein